MCMEVDVASAWFWGVIIGRDCLYFFFDTEFCCSLLAIRKAGRTRRIFQAGVLVWAVLTRCGNVNLFSHSTKAMPVRHKNESCTIVLWPRLDWGQLLKESLLKLPFGCHIPISCTLCRCTVERQALIWITSVTPCRTPATLVAGWIGVRWAGSIAVASLISHKTPCFPSIARVPKPPAFDLLHIQVLLPPGHVV